MKIQTEDHAVWILGRGYPADGSMDAACLPGITDCMMAYTPNGRFDKKRQCSRLYEGGGMMQAKDFREDLQDFLSMHPYKTIEVDGVRWKYILMGDADKQPVIFLNGLNMQEMWIRYAGALERDYRILIMEYPLVSRTNDELLDQIRAFLDRLDIRKPIVIGASDGGMLAQLYVRRFPDRISGLILMTTITIDSGYVEDIKKEPPIWLFQLVLKMIPFGVMRKRLISQVKSYFHGETEKEQQYGASFLKTIASDPYYKKKFIHACGLVNDMARYEKMRTEEFAPVEGRILLLHPEQDIFTKEDQGKLTEVLPDPEVKYMRGGHLSCVMCADEYIREIRDFIADFAVTKSS